jgi:two-component system, NtrC family, sensor histidine kinase KinB
MTLKTKLILGLGFLFLIIFTLVGFCSYYVGRLGDESDNILKDNYASLVYSRNMLSGLDEMQTAITSTIHSSERVAAISDYYRKLFESGKSRFETNLQLENRNITEIHEKEYVEKLTLDHNAYLKLSLRIINEPGSSSLYFSDFLPASERLKQSINAIYDINMQAVVRKNQLAKHDSAAFLNSMAIIGTICLLLALGYFWYFPVYISTTLSYLSEKMRSLLKSSDISSDIKTKDEAFAILHGIELLENKLTMKT